MATPEEITRHHELAPDHHPWVGERPQPAPIGVVEYDDHWPAQFETVAAAVRAALGGAALAVEHVGSTSVPGLLSKPTIDVDLTVADPADEAAYVPPLEGAGFVLVVREPDWHRHRCLKLAEPNTNLQVFGPGCPEPIRHRTFRQWHLERFPGPGPPGREATSRVEDHRPRRHLRPMFRAHGLLP